MDKKIKIKVGDYVTFRGKTMMIYGFVARINKNYVDYIRESLTRWSVDTSMIERGEIIDKDNFKGSYEVHRN